MNNVQPIAYTNCGPAAESLKPLDFDASPVTKFLTPAQRSAIARQSVSFDEVKELAEVINTPGGIVPIAEDLKDHDIYAPIALRALNEKLIIEEQFGTICILYSAIDQMIAHPARFEVKYNPSIQNFDFHRIPVSDTDSFYKSNVTTVPLVSNAPENIYLRQFFHATEDGLERVIANMQACPESERYFWLFECPFGPLFSWSPLLHRLNEISTFFKTVNQYQIYKSNALHPYQPQYLVVPSLSLIKAFAAMACPASYLQLQPGLGCFEKEDIIAYKKQGIRLVNIGMPGADCPETADGLFGGKYVFTHHDYYHYLRDCLTPRSFQRAINRVATLLEGLMQTFETKEIEWKLYDGEIFSFKMGKEGGEIADFGAIFNKIKWSQIAKETVINDMVQNAELWHKEYEITVFSLSQPERSIYYQMINKI